MFSFTHRQPPSLFRYKMQGGQLVDMSQVKEGDLSTNAYRASYDFNRQLQNFIRNIPKPVLEGSSPQARNKYREDMVKYNNYVKSREREFMDIYKDEILGNVEQRFLEAGYTKDKNGMWTKPASIKDLPWLAKATSWIPGAHDFLNNAITKGETFYNDPNLENALELGNTAVNAWNVGKATAEKLLNPKKLVKDLAIQQGRKMLGVGLTPHPHYDSWKKRKAEPSFHLEVSFKKMKGGQLGEEDVDEDDNKDSDEEENKIESDYSRKDFKSGYASLSEELKPLFNKLNRIVTSNFNNKKDGNTPILIFDKKIKSKANEAKDYYNFDKDTIAVGVTSEIFNKYKEKFKKEFEQTNDYVGKYGYLPDKEKDIIFDLFDKRKIQTLNDVEKNINDGKIKELAKEVKTTIEPVKEEVKEPEIPKELTEEQKKLLDQIKEKLKKDIFNEKVVNQFLKAAELDIKKGVLKTIDQFNALERIDEPDKEKYFSILRDSKNIDNVIQDIANIPPEQFKETLTKFNKKEFPFENIGLGKVLERYIYTFINDKYQSDKKVMLLNDKNPEDENYSTNYNDAKFILPSGETIEYDNDESFKSEYSPIDALIYDDEKKTFQFLELKYFNTTYYTVDIKDGKVIISSSGVGEMETFDNNGNIALPFASLHKVIGKDDSLVPIYYKDISGKYKIYGIVKTLSTTPVEKDGNLMEEIKYDSTKWSKIKKRTKKNGKESVEEIEIKGIDKIIGSSVAIETKSGLYTADLINSDLVDYEEILHKEGNFKLFRANIKPQYVMSLNPPKRIEDIQNPIEYLKEKEKWQAYINKVKKTFSHWKPDTGTGIWVPLKLLKELKKKK